MKIEDYKISIVIPTFNRIGSLPRALDSALNQTYQPSEIIVVDNGSSDGTTKLLRERYPSIRLLIEKKLGVSAARNKGIRHSKFQWIALLDSDDAWDKTKLEKQRIRMRSGEQRKCWKSSASGASALVWSKAFVIFLSEIFLKTAQTTKAKTNVS